MPNIRCTCGKFLKYHELETLVKDRGYSVDEAFTELGIIAPCCQMNIRPMYVSTTPGAYNVKIISCVTPLTHDVHQFSSSKTETSSTNIPWRSMEIVTPAAPKSLKMTTGKRISISIPQGRVVTSGESSSSSSNLKPEGLREDQGSSSSTQTSGLIKARPISIPQGEVGTGKLKLMAPVKEDPHTGYRGPGKVVGYVDVGGGLGGSDKRYMVPILERAIKSE